MRSPLNKEYWAEVVDGFRYAEAPGAKPYSKANSSTFPSEKKSEFSDKEHTIDILSSSDNDRTHEQNALLKDEIDDSNLNKDLDIRHLLTLAVGGAIGTGLFVNSGASLNTGGPASLVIGWVIISSALFTVINSLGELAATYPVVGGFNVYMNRFIDPSIAFSISLNYLVQWLVLLPLELVAASITIRYWNDKINSDAWVTIFYVFICLANMVDVKSFGEIEFVLSLIKILAIVGFTILGVVLSCGGGPEGGYIGGKYWHDPGAFVGNNAGSQFKGLCSVFVTAAFSYSGIEMIAVSAAESVNPKKTIPMAAKRTFWLITASYITVLTLIGCLVPYNDERLLDSSSSVDIASSPLVIAIENGGIKGLPSLMNAVILIAIISVANSAVYACSRCMVSMALLKTLPKLLSRVDKRGRPTNAIFVTLFFGLLSFVAASDKQNEIFTWLSALSGLSTIFCWMGINLAHIRFRRAMTFHNRSLDELPYLSQTGIYGSLYGCTILFLVLIASFWTSLFPVGGSGANATSFFEGYLSFPILVACYVGHKFYFKNWRWFTPYEEIDLDSGRRNVDLDILREEMKMEQQAIKNSSFIKRFLHVWC